MYEFNPDGSLKIPGEIGKANDKLRSQKCIKIKREVMSFDAPKKCVLRITISDAITDDRFIENLYNFFKEKAETPSKISKNGKEVEIEIGTNFRRCSDCNSLIRRYREFLHGNIIEDKGSCTFEGFKKSFAYEDYF